MPAALLVLLTGGMVVVVAEVAVQCRQPVVEGGTVLGKGDTSRWTGKTFAIPFVVPRTSWPGLLAVVGVCLTDLCRAGGVPAGAGPGGRGNTQVPGGQVERHAPGLR